MQNMTVTGHHRFQECQGIKAEVFQQKHIKNQY